MKPKSRAVQPEEIVLPVTVVEITPGPDLSEPAPPILGIITAVFPFGAIARREDGSRLSVGDTLRDGESITLQSSAASAVSPPLGIRIGKNTA